VAVVATPVSARVPLSRWVLLVVVGGAALLLGPVVAAAPVVSFFTAVALVLTVAAFVHPPVAAYVLLATTPLIVGIDRGDILPVLRPNEAVAVLMVGAVLLRGGLEVARGQPVRWKIRTPDAALLLLVVTGSLLPLVWRAARGGGLSQDDVLYGIVLPKYYAIYLAVRTSIRTETQVRRCLWLSMGAGVLVAVIGILQALKLFGVPALLARHYAAYGDTDALYISRGSSTVSNAQAMADVMALNLAIAAGWLAQGSRRSRLLAAAAMLFVVATLASGTFSGAFALVTAALALGIATGRLQRAVLALLWAGSAAVLAVRPVVSHRLSSFSTARGPRSLVARTDNLKAYFWPELTRDYHYVLGVRPSARVALPGPDKFVFIESGHTWLLWTGGIPLLSAFIAFLYINLRTVFRVARRRADAIGVAATASFAGLAVLAVLTTFDPHLTLRGSADLNFSLLALAHIGMRDEVPA
jgi:hypothetical protein